METWYRQQAGIVAGPFSFEDLHYLVSRGNLDADDLVRRGQEGRWLAAADVQGLIDPHRSVPALPQTVSRGIGETGTVPPVATREGPSNAAPNEGVPTGISESSRQLSEDSAGSSLASELQLPVSPEQRSEVDQSVGSPSGHKVIRQEQFEPNDAGTQQPPSEPPTHATFSIQEFAPHADRESRFALGSSQSDGPPPKLFQGRTPERRAELARRDGGSPKSEAAVELGLKWLVNHQHDAGNWSLDHYMTALALCTLEVYYRHAAVFDQ